MKTTISFIDFLATLEERLAYNLPVDSESMSLKYDLGFDSVDLFQVTCLLDELEADPTLNDVIQWNTLADVYQTYTRRHRRTDPNNTKAETTFIEGVIDRNESRRPKVTLSTE